MTEKKESGKVVTLTNRMRSPWIVPLQLVTGIQDILPKATDNNRDERAAKSRAMIASVIKKRRVIYPNQYCEVYAASFDYLYKHSHAFKYQIDGGLIVKGKKRQVDRESLKRSSDAKAPDELMNNPVDDRVAIAKNKAGLTHKLADLKPHNAK